MSFTASYIYRILDQYSGPLARITRATERFRETTARAQAQARKIGTSMRDAGAKMTAGLTLPIVGFGVAAAKTAIDFQDAMIGVQKTVEATPKQLAAMNEQFKRMSTIMPVSATDLMKIGESAGQLGIQTKNITSFTRTIAMLGATTNLTGEEGATQLARFANITQMSQDNFDRLGSTIVALGNNLATTEAEIVAMGMRLAGAGNVVGLTEAQIMAMSGTLTSLGINAEAGGTAFSKVMMEMNDAVAKGGPMLSAFAAVGGMSAKQMASTFKKDASKGILAFVEGLGKLRAEGKNVNKILEVLEFNDIRVKDALLRASGSGDLFRKAMALGNKAWKDNNALAKEARLRFKSWSSQLKIAWNRLKLFANSIGVIVVPMFIDFINLLQPILDFFAKLSPTIKKVLVVVAALVAAIGPLIMVFGMLAIAIGAITAPMLTIAGIVAGVVAIIGLLTWAFVEVWQRSTAFRQSLYNLMDAFSPLVELIRPIVVWIGEKLGMSFKSTGADIKFWGDTIAVVINGVAAVIRGLIELLIGLGQYWKQTFVVNLEAAMSGLKKLDSFVSGVGGKIEGFFNSIGFGPRSESVGKGVAAEKAGARQDNKIEFSGSIGVSASGGSQVDHARIGLNTGSNQAYDLRAAH